MLGPPSINFNDLSKVNKVQGYVKKERKIQYKKRGELSTNSTETFKGRSSQSWTQWQGQKGKIIKEP